MLKVKTLTLGDMETNCYVLNVEGSNNAVLIDPADNYEIIEKYLKENGLIIDCIILTHAHFDHIGALSEVISGFHPLVIMNKNDYDFLSDSKLNLSSRFMKNTSISIDDNIVFVCDENKRICDIDFRFIHTPGHTPGSMCIIAKDSIFTGDTLFYSSVGNAFPPYGNLNEEILSIKNKLFTLDGNYICYPGHGPVTSLEFEKKNNPYLGVSNNGY